MKKKIKKLSLGVASIRDLSVVDLGAAHGGASEMCNSFDTWCQTLRRQSCADATCNAMCASVFGTRCTGC